MTDATTDAHAVTVSADVATAAAGDPALYSRDPRYIPRVAAVHDMCGYGKCSLTAAIPILSAAGCDVCPVPTALFSAHTKYDVFTFHDTTGILPGYLDAWKAEHVDLDGVYSGFLGSPEQVAIIRRLYREYPRALRFVDPVMGDGGELYPTYTPELCEAMRALVDGADVLMPNLTEAAILAGRDYAGGDLDDRAVNGLLDALLGMGARHVVLKGVDRGDGLIRNYVADAAGGAAGRRELAHEKLSYMIQGTGDAFASALCGAVMAGRGLAESARIAGEFVRHAMGNTRNQPRFEERGLSFELNLGELTGLVG
ncbi:bifunctional hydroxymethylpyrimidine kinase/phosphomethylpyrimidine kinase [Bifidobacterium sp. 82T10]|uniref:Bifunctional hydroxymethylpyrimidine kinase/phosphomethylpyrimidine kinase n=1 Tax=Bifidobacterium miconis TaxID=2834435 RepID=A0ABS6WE36_9BIFI|nr:bifunctional hydroxymethylpyrimidine kinase/phosphomethylpyrimidine kinase [Bifidobacterium miconis]MBW3092306.1 bifunctional hydroxymethylpyrimidine kinase/phosphomethylpyrimidine kinase [Bifidobacterium miconis]